MDLKLDNVMIRDADGSPVILDYGLSGLKKGELFKPRATLQDEEFMSPELLAASDSRQPTKRPVLNSQHALGLRWYRQCWRAALE